jgi:hypothetical protein
MRRYLTANHSIPALLALAIAAPGAFAHDTYLLTDRFTTPSPMALFLTSAAKFPAMESGPKKARIASMNISGPDATATVEAVEETATALRFALKASQPGAYVIGVTTPMRDIDLKPEEVEEYFAEIEAPASLRAAYDALPQPRLWKETYSKFVKSVVCVEACADYGALSTALGHDFEFVSAPGNGGAALGRFMIMRSGRAAAGQAVAISSANGNRVVVHAGEDGGFELPQALSGVILLSAVVIDPPTTPGARFTSAFATLTLDLGMKAGH